MSLRRRLAIGASSFGGTLLIVAALVAALGPTHEQVAIVHAGIAHMHSVSTGWFDAAVAVGVIGLLLVVVGGIGIWLTNESPAVGDNHANTLERALDTVENCIANGNAVVFGTGPKDRLGKKALPLHFKHLKLGRRWEPRVAAYNTAVAALRAKVGTVATERGIVEPSCDHDYICTTASAIAVASARANTLGSWTPFNWGGHVLDGVVEGAPKGDLNQRWIKLAVGGDSSAAIALGQELRDRINDLVRDAQGLSEASAVRDAYRQLDASREALLADIHLIREQWPPKRVRKCDGCK